MYKDIKDYFYDLNVPFIYDFFRKIHMLMVCGFNFISQALLINIDRAEHEKACKSTTSNESNLIFA